MVLFCFSCRQNTAGHNTELKKSNNFVLLLDLSDRLIINSNQVDIDTSVIRAVFEKFEEVARNNMWVKSKDKFSVRIITQNKSTLPINQFENSLTLDLSNYTSAEKYKKFIEFKESLGKRIKSLYSKAYLGNNSHDYSGVDIWQYFNEQINNDIKVNYNNNIIVLTDGYFDFEDKNRGLISVNQSTVSRHLMLQLKNDKWKQNADENNIGLIPVNLQLSANFIIAGIQSKTDDLLEASKLSYLWSKWIKQSGGNILTNPIINTSSNKLKTIVYDLL